MKKFFYTFAFILCALMTLQAETMVVATYNLRNANGGDSTNGNGWGQRYPYIAQIVQFHGFDIFGTQEGKYPQLQDLKQAMPGYDYIGVGRDDGKQAGEHSAIFLPHGQVRGLGAWRFLAIRDHRPSEQRLGRRSAPYLYVGRVSGQTDRLHFLVLQPSYGSCRRTSPCRER